MPHVNELKKWLKVSDLKIGDIVKFADRGNIKTFEFVNKQTQQKETGNALEFQVSVNGGDIKKITLNNFSIKSLSEAWGGEYDLWYNKDAIADGMKMASFGKIIDSIYLKPAN